MLPAVANPVITIYPIGNHTIGDLITITGTTNVPAGTVLSISVGPSTFTNYRPNYFMGQTTVIPGTGTNTWSTVVNTTEFIADQYHLTVAPIKGYALSNDTTFNLAFANSMIPSAMPYITIDPIGNHAFDDGFFINGTTNLGHWENTLNLDIEWWVFNPAGRWSSMYITNASIQSVGNGTGIWSAKILPAQWEMYTDVEHRTTVFRDVYPGEYVAYVSSSSSLGPTVIAQQTFFIVPDENNRTSDTSSTIQPSPETELVNASLSPLRQDTPLPVTLPFVALFAVIVCWTVFHPGKRA